MEQRSRTAGLMSTASTAAALTSGGGGADVDRAEWGTGMVIAEARSGHFLYSNV